MNEALVLPMRLSVTRARQLRIGCCWRTLIQLAHLVSKTNRPERTRRLLAVAESVCAKCLTLVEHDRNADRHGGYDHPNGQEEPKIEPIPAAVSLVDFRRRLFEVAAVLVTKKRDLRQESLHLRLQQKSGQLEQPSRLRLLRRQAAQVETVLTTRAEKTETK